MVKINVTEVCPRDGWQNYKGKILDHTWKVEMVKKMILAGAKSIDLASFVNAKYVPQMADATYIFQDISKWIAEQNLDVDLLGLALNGRGLEDAVKAGVKTVQFVISASEEHNMRNSRKSVSESFEDLKDLYAKVKGIDVVLSIACAFASPFGDEVTYENLAKLIRSAKSLGINRFGVADTAGIVNPGLMRERLRLLKSEFGLENFSLHMHDSRGMGLANILVALEEGVTNFDSSLGGMGGCPFVPKAKGNIATEDLLNMLHSMGYETGYDIEKVLEIGNYMLNELEIAQESSMMTVYRNR